MSITEDVEEFIRLHRKHGPLVGGAAEPTLIGHRVTIACPLRRDVRAPCDGRRGDGRPGEAGAAESTMLDSAAGISSPRWRSPSSLRRSPSCACCILARHVVGPRRDRRRDGAAGLRAVDDRVPSG